MEYPKLPFDENFLERYRLDARRLKRPDMAGGHVVLKSGQSLEFRELDSYYPGCDIRHVDWKASAKAAGPRDWLVRKFESERLDRMVVSVDTRDTMAMPEAIPKLTVAGWLAEALARIALRSGWQVCVHRLFGTDRNGLKEFRSRNMASEVCKYLKKMVGGKKAGSPDSGKPNLTILDGYLPPACVWVLATDLYFQKWKAVAEKVRSASRGSRWIFLFDLDSWIAETKDLAEGNYRLESPGSSGFSSYCHIADTELAIAKDRIARHKQTFLEKSGIVDISRWKWDSPATGRRENADAFFKRKFLADRKLPALFMKGSW